MGGLFRVYWGFTARWRSRTQISHSNWALLVGTGQVGQGIRSHVGWGQGRLLGAGWFRHGSYLSGQRHFLGEVSIERRTRWQAWREREGLKAGHATGGWYLWNWAKTERLWGNRHCSSRDQLATQSWGGTLGLKRQGPAMQMCLCGYRGDLHSTCPLGIYLISLWTSPVSAVGFRRE